MCSRRESIGVGLALIALAALAGWFFRARFTHRVSSDKTSEFVYLSQDLALFRQGTTNFSLGLAHWSGYPDYANGTGDVVSRVIVARVSAVAITQDSKTVFGRGVRPREHYPRDLEDEWFVVARGNVEWYSSADEMTGRHGELMGASAVPLRDFFRLKHLSRK